MSHSFPTANSTQDMKVNDLSMHDQGCVHAAFSFSMYTPPLILLPFAAPLIKRLAHHFPDEGLSRVKAGRQVIIDIVKELLAERRQELAVEQVRPAHA